MKKILLFIVFALAMTNVSAQTTGDYKSNTANANLNSASGWQTFDGTTWVAATYAPLGGNITQSGTTASASVSVTLAASNPLIRDGQYVTGAGIAAGTTVTSVSGTTLTLSQNATADATVTLTFAETFTATGSASSSSTAVTLGAGNPAIVVGMAVTGTGIATGTKVNSISGTTLTLSTNTTAAISSGTLTFYTLQTSASFTTGATTITLGAANSLLSEGMIVYATSGILAGTKVTSVSGTTIGISMPTTAAITNKVGLVFGVLNIPNLTINHTVSNGGNSRPTTIGNVIINSGGNLTLGGTSTFGTDLICKTITVNSGGSLGTTSNANGKTNTLEVNGGEGGTCFTNNGTVDLTTATGGTSFTNITFTVPGSTIMSGSGTTNFNKITMNMCGVQSNTLDIQSAFSMLAATTAPTLTLTSGTLKISGASTITPFGGNGTSAFNAIPLIAGLYLNNASATINWGDAVTDASGMQVRGALTLAAGTLYVKGRYDANGVGTTTISGGTLEIPAGLTISKADAALFHVASLHTFLMSGGNLNLKSHNIGGYANPDYYNLSTIQSVTGGTITFSDAAAMNSNATKFYNLVVQSGAGAGTTLTRGSVNSTILNSLTVESGNTIDNGTLTFLPFYSISGNTTNASTSIALQSSGCVAAGQYVLGTGIPAGTTVTDITQAQTTGIVTSGSASITGVPTNVGYAIGSLIFGNGITTGTTVSNITGSGPYTLTLSANATASSATAEVLIINPVITISNAATATGSAIALNFYNATAFTNSGSGTITIRSTTNPSYPANTTWSSTMNFDGNAGNLNLFTGTYNNVIINNTHATSYRVYMQTGINYLTGTTYSGASRINGAFILTSGIFTPNGKPLTIAGSSLTRTSGTIDLSTSSSGSMLTFANTTPLTIPSGLFSANIYRLTLNGAGGVTLSSPITVDNTLTLTNGLISLGANDLTIGAAGSISGGSATSYVVTDGAGKLNLPVAAAVAKLLPIGTSTSSYDPATVTPTDATGFSAKVSATLSQTPASGSFYNPREWTLTPVAASSTVVSLTPSTDAATGIYSVIGTSDGASSYTNSYVTPVDGTYTGTYSIFMPFVTGKTDTPTSIQGASKTTLNVYAQGNKLMINGLNAGDAVSIYKLNGQQVKSYKATANQTSTELTNGAYIVKVKTVAEMKVSKVIVK